MLRVIRCLEPAEPKDQNIVFANQQSLDQGNPYSSSGDVDIHLHRRSTFENLLGQEQHQTYQTGPFSSRSDTSINGTAQHKRERTDADQPYFSTHDAPINETTQQKRQKLNPDPHSAVEEQRQHGRQGPTPGTFSLKQDTRILGASQVGRPTQGGAYASSSRNTRSDGANERGQKEPLQEAPYSSRHHTTSDRIDEGEHQAPRSRISPSPPRTEDVEVLTPGMNMLPPPSWGDERLNFFVAQRQLIEERYYERRRQRLDAIWALYKREREALAAVHIPEPEEMWEPDFEEGEILERDIPLMDEIWARSVLAGDDWMREILDMDETWLPEPLAEPNFWTREEGGMLSSAVLRKYLHILTLLAALEEEPPQRSDDDSRAAANNRVFPTWHDE